MFDKYYKDYWEMLTKKVPSPYKYFIDINWRSKKNAENTKIGKIWIKYLKNVNTVLDYGGGSGLTGEMLNNLKWNGKYELLDSSKNINPDYYDIDDVTKKYDMIVCLQVIEHLYFEDFLDLIEKLTQKLKTGGILVIGSDHPANAGHLWNVEMGHVKSYPFHNLHQYLQMNGFNHNNSSIVLQYMDEYKLVKYLLYLIRKVILQILGISPFMSYVIFIEKKE